MRAVRRLLLEGKWTPKGLGRLHQSKENRGEGQGNDKMRNEDLRIRWKWGARRTDHGPNTRGGSRKKLARLEEL